MRHPIPPGALCPAEGHPPLGEVYLPWPAASPLPPVFPSGRPLLRGVGGPFVVRAARVLPVELAMQGTALVGGHILFVNELSSILVSTLGV